MAIGMFTFRFGGLDGVSLEAAKLADVIRDAGHDVAWFGGWLDPAFAPGSEVPDADYDTLANQDLQGRLFGTADPDPGSRRLIEERAALLRLSIEAFIEDHSIDVLMPHNVLSLPLHLPLAVAVADILDDGSVRAVAHHHDWWFERESFSPNNVSDLIERCFPYRDSDHLVINTKAAVEVKARFGLEADYVPNVMDFETGSEPADDSAFRAHAGLSGQDVVLLQPTRAIARKGIETTIALAAALDDPAIKVVVTHAADRDMAYWARLEVQAKVAGVDLRFVPTAPGRGLAEAYAAADLVCFPSVIEGFGNALLEAFFYRRPVFINRYDVYARDIGPTGVQCVEISDGELTPKAVGDVARWLGDRDSYAGAVDANYQAGLSNFSYAVVRERVLPLLER